MNTHRVMQTMWLHLTWALKGAQSQLGSTSKSLEIGFDSCWEGVRHVCADTRAAVRPGDSAN